ncbi:MAG: hypothetical protein ACRDT2_19660, partial [Natronosporangium sp.]
MPVVVALPVEPADPGADPGGVLSPEVAAGLPDWLGAECASLLEQTLHTGRAGAVQNLPRPLGRPRRV